MIIGQIWASSKAAASIAHQLQVQVQVQVQVVSTVVIARFVENTQRHNSAIVCHRNRCAVVP